MAATTRSEFWFSVKVAAFNAAGFLLATLVPTYLDPKLTSEKVYGVRTYPLGYWIALVGPVVFAITFLCLTRIQGWKSRCAVHTALLTIVLGLCLLNFLPMFPHLHVVGWGIYFTIVSLVVTWIKYAPIELAGIEDIGIEPQARIERVKESVALWRTLALSLAVAYLAILVPWYMGIASCRVSEFAEARDQLAIMEVSTIDLIVLSAYVLLGPIYESFNKATEVAEMLLRVKCPNA
jgi:hypothetical protein